MPRGKVFGPSTHYIAGPPKTDSLMQSQPGQANNKSKNLAAMTEGGQKAFATIKGEITAIHSKNITNKPQTRIKKDKLPLTSQIRWEYGDGQGEEACIGSKLRRQTARKAKSVYT
jgi:hypothetical protein